MKKLVVAIDGPAASGKSTTARLTAERLGYLHIDTGAMYRAMTVKVLDGGCSPDDCETIAHLAVSTEIRIEREAGMLRVFLDDRDVTEAIRSRAVTQHVSAVSSIPGVRALMVREQRRMAEAGGVVLEGRDIGTVVVPGADLKIFMIADVDERSRRRHEELAQQGVDVPLEDLRQEIIQRDQTDSQRAISPLRKADDAIVLDTSRLTVEQQVEFIVRKAEVLLAERA